jgi:hypothetical protein
MQQACHGEKCAVRVKAAHEGMQKAPSWFFACEVCFGMAQERPARKHQIGPRT